MDDIVYLVSMNRILPNLLVNLILPTAFLVFMSCTNTRDSQSNTSGTAPFQSWAPTPPMGWNSWDCYGPTVREDEVKANADYMAEHLAPSGWEYIVVDIRWFVENTRAGGYNQTDPRYVIDPYGRYLPAENRFPSAANDQGFKSLADYIHAKGLKFGIHIMRGVPKMAVERKLPIKGTAGITADQIFSPDGQCEWLQDNYTIVSTQPGAQEYYNSIFDLYAEWGVDFVKVDDIARPYHEEEIELIRHAIDQTGRPIVLSLSPGATPLDKAEHVAAHANMWRMVDDVWDTWPHLRHLMDVAPTWYPYISTGAWPDCDMIPLGRISIRGERGPDRRSRLTPDEQISLMTLFTISKSPLFFGGDLPSNDSLTLTLMTNPAVLEMHRAAGQVKTIIRDDRQLVITARHPTDRTAYLAIFNLLDAGSELNISIPFSGLNLPDSCRVTELWSNLELGYLQDSIQTRLLPHASKLFRLTR